MPIGWINPFRLAIKYYGEEKIYNSSMLCQFDQCKVAKAVPDDKDQQDEALFAVAHCHCDCTAILPSIALPPPSPIAILLLSLPSPIALTTIYGNCHWAVAAVLSSIAPPPLMRIRIVPLLLPFPTVTSAIAHCCHRHPLQSRCHPAIHCAVNAVTHQDCTAIMPPCVTS
jgi:hypothetical protein